MFDTTAHSCRVMSVIILIILCIVNIAAVRQAFFHGYAMPSLCVCVCVCVCRRMRTVISTHVYTVNVVVEWRQLAAICVNVYVQVRV